MSDLGSTVSALTSQHHRQSFTSECLRIDIACGLLRAQRERP